MSDQHVTGPGQEEAPNRLNRFFTRLEEHMRPELQGLAPWPPEQELAVSHFTFCHHPLCSQGSPALRAAVSQAADQQGLDLALETTVTVCPGTCTRGPWVGMPQKGLFYRGLRLDEVEQLLTETVRQGRMLFPHLYLEPTKVTDSRVVWEKHDHVIVAISPEMCLVDVTAYLFWFNAAQSCGKCTPCRLGVPEVARLLNNLRLHQVQGNEVDLLEELVRHMGPAAFCTFAGKVTDPLRMALEHLRYEFQRHLEQECRRHQLTGPEAKPADPSGRRDPWASRPGLNRSFQAGVLRTYDPRCQAAGFLKPEEGRDYLLRPGCVEKMS
ncbi:MAG: hypothetical protein C4525_02740 [Desulfarculus sp.]|nr:MAG: hypothetical protein C4525_02740 [Desulfarculus sp.]